MKNTIIGGLFALLAAILAVFLGHYLTQENIDIRYTLSDSIPATFLGEESLKNIQQLNIINRGDTTAENLRIILEKKISKYELTKYSDLDKVEINSSENNLNILYPELPPEGKINLVFSTNYILPLMNSQVKISHSKGVGKEAFDEKNNFIYSLFSIPIILMFMLIFFIITESFSLRNKWLERDALKGEEDIFTKKKTPWLMSIDRWNEIRKEAIEKYVKKRRLNPYEIEDSNILKFLNSEKPEYLKEHEWDFLVKESQTFFEENILSCLNVNNYNLYTIEHILKVSKPKNFNQIKWDKILKNIHEHYIFLLKENAINSISIRDEKGIFEKIKEENNFGINDELWKSYKTFLKYLYKVSLIINLFDYHENYIKYINKFDISIIDKSNIELIKSISYKLQINNYFPHPFTLTEAQKFLKEDRIEWLEENDYNRLKINAHEIIDLHNQKIKINSIKSLFQDILFNRDLPEEKPIDLDSDEWNNLKIIKRNILDIEENIYRNKGILEEISEKERTIPNLIDKLNFQLSTINDFLSDPSVLDRIEDYNNRFSPGNFQNLQKIAAYLRNIKNA